MEVRAAVLRRGREKYQSMMRAQCLHHFLFCLIMLVLLRETVAVPNLRGVATEDEQYYQTAIIRCRDGSKTFSQERLNDDFCDCVDGTDEPGTNACPEAKFTCKNLGHRAVKLFSSRVNDGICDCCDGSDEYAGKIQCSNTCWESGKQSREKQKKKYQTFKDGSVIRKRDIESAQKLRQQHEFDLVQMRSEERTLKDVVAKLKVEKEAVEKAEKLDRDEKERREKEERERMEKEKELEKAAAIEEGQQAEEATSQIEESPESLKEVNAVSEEEAEVEGLVEQLSEAERGRVIASRWTGEDVSDILSKGEDDHADIENDDEEMEEAPNTNEDDEDEDYIAPHVVPSDPSTPYDSESDDDEGSSWWSRLSKGLRRTFGLDKQPVDVSEADRIRTQYHESNSKLSSLQSKIEELESRAKLDFGKDGEFYSYYDQCFEYKEKKYVYKVCPYKDAKQVEGHSSTRLGRWIGFKEDYKEMIFQNGDKCWNGPERSLRVKMRCGTKLEIRKVDEPSRCDYVAEFSTPALCLASKVKALEAQLSAQDPSGHDEL